MQRNKLDPACMDCLACLGCRCKRVMVGRDKVSITQLEPPKGISFMGTSVALMQAHSRAMDPQEVARLIRRRQEEYLLRVAPFTKVMADLMNLQPVKYVTKEGEEIVSFERVVLWDAKSQQTYDQAAAMVEAIGREYFPGGEDGTQTAV